jgi:hypothetical protein
MFYKRLNTIDEKIEYINNYEIHPAIIQRFTTETNKKFKIELLDEHINLAIQSLKDFFCAIFIQDKKVNMVSAITDELWHVFILYTLEYQNFCKPLGTFIHHAPDNIDVWGKTDLLLENENNKKFNAFMTIYKTCCEIEGLNRF